MEYIDTVFIWLKKGIKPGEKLSIASLTKTPEKFIEAVKQCINDGLITDIEFTNDYSEIRKIKPMPTANNVFNKNN